jgi:hypothetical protein
MSQRANHPVQSVVVLLEGDEWRDCENPEVRPQGIGAKERFGRRGHG